MDAGQWSEGSGVVKSMEEKKSIRPQALNCPRCNSSHTKFCYYNNYSLSQPRFFCKTCRRYWTNGGSLRNVPVGGGSRRNKRSSGASLKNQQQLMMIPQPQNPSKTMAVQSQGQSQVQGQGHDLTLGGISLRFGNLPYNPNTTAATSSSQFSATEFVKGGFADPRDVIMNSPAAGLNYSFNEFQNGVGYHHHLQAQGVVTNHESNISDASANERILFPFQDLNPMSNSKTEILGATRDSSTGYWGTQGLGGGSSCW